MRRLLPALLTFSLMISACNLPAPAPPPTPTLNGDLVGTIAAQTLQALISATPDHTLTPLPSQTPRPSQTPTYAQPQALLSGDTNCRGGPGSNYPVVSVLLAGQTVNLTGRAESGNYWLIESPNGDGQCWFAGDYAQVTGSLQSLPTASAPPTLTAQPPSAPAWQTWNYSCAFASGGSTLTFVMTWTDRNPNRSGFNILRNEEIAASLPAEAAAYTDVAFVASGQSLTYVIEVVNGSGKARSSAVTVSCQ